MSYPLPLKIRRSAESFAVEDASGRALSYVYFDDGGSLPRSLRRPTDAEAREIAQIIARALTDAAEKSD